MRRLLIPVSLTVALVLSACSGADEEIALPEDPPGAELLDHVAVETQLDILSLAVREATGSGAGYERMFDVTDSGSEDLIAHYDEALTAQEWDRVESTAAISGVLGATWERDGQKVVLALVTIDGVDVALVLTSD